MRYMRYSKWFLVLWSLSLIAGCSKDSLKDGDATDPVTDPTPEIAACNGICVDAAPATFTGPSEFWMGPPGAAPACPSYMNLQGIQGMITAPTTMTDLYARECRVESAGTCASASFKCVPFPAEDYHVCIHHDEDRPCPSDYPYDRTMIDESSGAPVTVCCGSGHWAG